MNAHLRQAQYAVRGELVLCALNHAKEMKEGVQKPFSKLVYCNIGNPLELGQQPITFFRQVFALVNYPQLLEDPRTAQLFPADAIARARKYVASIPGGTGAYSKQPGRGEHQGGGGQLHQQEGWGRGSPCKRHLPD